MAMHPDLNEVLAPHLHALSAAPANLLAPLTSVLTTLITEVAALRAAHDQLQTHVSRIDAQLPIPLPNTIPSPPTSPPPSSLTIDPDLTQPPSPPPPQTPHQEHPVKSTSTHFQYETPQQYEQNSPAHPSNGLGTCSERLKRKKRSSKRPHSDTPESGTVRVKREKCEQPDEAVSSQQNQACKARRPGSSNSSTLQTPSSFNRFANADKECETPKKICGAKRKPLKERSLNQRILPTTPTTDAKPRKAKSSVLPNKPVLNGYRNVVAAAKAAEDIASRREAENCPPAFRFRQKPLYERTCLECQNALRAQAAEAPDPDIEFQRLLRSGCRHEEQISRPDTPEGYWALDFQETLTQPP